MSALWARYAVLSEDPETQAYVIRGYHPNETTALEHAREVIACERDDTVLVCHVLHRARREWVNDFGEVVR